MEAWENLVREEKMENNTAQQGNRMAVVVKRENRVTLDSDLKRISGLNLREYPREPRLLVRESHKSVGKPQKFGKRIKENYS